VSAGKQIFILINFAQENRRVALPRSMKLLLDGKWADSVDLTPYGVAIALDR
jgi:hypothetical protein